MRRAGRRNGADVMGHLFEAMCRLANAMARQGRGSSAGDFVPNGRIVETGWRAAGEARAGGRCRGMDAGLECSPFANAAGSKEKGRKSARWAMIL